MNKYSWILVLSLITSNLNAQKSRQEKHAARMEKVNALIKQEEEGLIVYKKHLIYGGTLNTDGYGILLEKGLRQDRRKTSIYRIELSEKKHIKEEKQPTSQNSLGQLNTAIVYKLNNFYQVKLGYGFQYLIGSKGNKNGVEVSAIGLGGLSIGLAKPYLFDAVDSSGKNLLITWDEFENNNSIKNIFGAAGFARGWNKVKVKPGIFLKTGLRFDYGRFNEQVSSVDLGLTAELFSSKIPQMYNLKQKQMFVGAYVSLLLGRRK